MISLLKEARPVFYKEFLDAIRDRRSLASALLFPMFAPLLVVLLFGAIAAGERDAEGLAFPIEGAEHAPGLMEWITRSGHDVVPVEGDLVEAVRSGALPLALRIDSTFVQSFAGGAPASIELITDGSKTPNAPLNRRVRTVLEAYSSQLSSLRLIARGVSPEVLTPVAIREIDVATAQQRSAVLLSFIPLLIIMAAFLSGMNVAIDATAGERERRSLEPLLINPVSGTAIVLGKWLVTVLLASAGIVLVLVATLIALQNMSLDDLGVRIDIKAPDVVAVLAGIVPLAFLASGLQLLVSVLAKSFKEAQTYISLLIVVPVIPGFLAMVISLPSNGWTTAVPALGQQMLLTEVLGGTNPGFGSFLIAGTSSMVLGLLCVILTARMFRNESLIFGTR